MKKKIILTLCVLCLASCAGPGKSTDQNPQPISPPVKSRIKHDHPQGIPFGDGASTPKVNQRQSEIKQLIRNLGDDDWQKREKIQKQLKNRPRETISELETALFKSVFS